MFIFYFLPERSSEKMLRGKLWQLNVGHLSRAFGRFSSLCGLWDLAIYVYFKFIIQ